MKHLLGRLLTLLVGSVVLWLPAVAHAQSTLPVIKVKIPFEFTIGTTTLPAGEYSLVSPVQHFVQLRDARGHFIAAAITNGVESTAVPKESVLKFYVEGGRHVLAEVWQEGNQVGEQFQPSTSPALTVANERTTSGDRVEGSQP